MEHSSLPNLDKPMSALTLGTWVFGGDVWGAAKERDGIEAVHAALDAGITCIDTAPIYGNGVSEEVVGKAIKDRREDVLLATKCGLRVNGRLTHNLSRDSIFKEIDDSLRRLQTGYIDLYQMHWPDENVPIEDSMAALMELKTAGKIRAVGISNHTPEQIDRALAVGPVVTSQDQYSLLERKIEKSLLPFLRERTIGLLAYGPLAGGILTGKYQRQPNFAKSDARSFFYPFYKGEAFARTRNVLDQLKSIGRPLNEIAINWVRQQKGVASVIVGCRTPEQVRANVKAVSWSLTGEQLNTIEQISHDIAFR